MRETRRYFLRCKIDTLERLCKDDSEALLLLRQVTTAPNHRPVSTDNVSTSEGSHGNSKAYTLDRLSRDRPDLLERVKSGQLSANKAMIEAGFRPKTLTIAATTCQTQPCSRFQGSGLPEAWTCTEESSSCPNGPGESVGSSDCLSWIVG